MQLWEGVLGQLWEGEFAGSCGKEEFSGSCGREEFW